MTEFIECPALIDRLRVWLAANPNGSESLRRVLNHRLYDAPDEPEDVEAFESLIAALSGEATRAEES